MPNPWEKQQDESDQAHAAFMLFRDLGTGRSLDAAYRKHRGAESGAGRASGTWRRWHTDNGWAERARAWDNRLQKAAEATAIKTVQKDAAAQTRRQLMDERRRKIEDIEHAVGSLAGRRLLDFLQSEASKKMEWKHVGPVAVAIQKLLRAAAKMPFEAVPDEQADIGETMFYDTAGQLEADLPPAVVPEMPAETHVKPAIDTAIRGDDARLVPDPRNRERPI